MNLVPVPVYIRLCLVTHSCGLQSFNLWFVLTVHGGVVVSSVISQQEGPEFKSGWGLSVWRLRVLPVCFAWILSGSKDMQPMGLA